MQGFRPTRLEIEALLAEDAPHGDLTTETLGIGSYPATMRFEAREAMIVAGSAVAAGLIEAAGGAVVLHAANGERRAAGDIILEAKGSAGALHRAWKQAQTAIELLSGIASAARDLVEAAVHEGRRIPVATTRKTFPGARRLQAAAARAGGAVTHRLGLSETILLFAEHRAFASGLSLAEMAARLAAGAPEKKIVIEVATPQEAFSAAGAGFDIIQMEKFTPQAVAEAAALVRSAHPGIVLAAAGGIGPANAGAYAAAGADLIVTSYPYTARPRDVKVTLSPA